MGKQRRVTYFSKDAISCPACATEFFREDLLSGSGRLIAGELTDELRRMYEPSRRYGEIFPLVYPVTVCPHCLYAALQQDFLAVEEQVVAPINATEDERKSSLELILPDVDFAEPRDLAEGAASYYLAMMCYDHFPRVSSPTVKQGLCALRCAWLFGDLHRRRSNENYDYLAALFYRKARFLYVRSVEREQTARESLGGLQLYGPDMDRNYGYDGVLYLTGLLDFKYGSRSDRARRLASLEGARRIVARVHGMGKASKAKPFAMLDRVRDLYDRINAEVKALTEEVGGQAPA